MMQHEWNGLRIDDRVVLHEQRDGARCTTRRGTVVVFHEQSSDNELGIRVDSTSADDTVWPSRFEAHATTTAALSVCPWCSHPTAHAAPAATIAPVRAPAVRAD